MQITFLESLTSGSDFLIGKYKFNYYLKTIQTIYVNIPIVKVSLFSKLAMSVIKTKNSEKYGFRGKFDS